MRSVVQRLMDTFGGQSDSVCFCTLAIGEPYRVRARQLCMDAAPIPAIVLTDEPGDFEDLDVHAVAHTATGPMASDYHRLGIEIGRGRGAAAYHDKRFALMAGLESFETAILIDADTRLARRPTLRRFPPGLALRPGLRESIGEHLGRWGPQRAPIFEALAIELFGTSDVLATAHWCSEGCLAVTREGRETEFFDAWGRGADFFQSRETYSGEGGVIGLAAAYAGCSVDYEALAGVFRVIRHEGGVGPRGE
jgi:hypothetical protein